MAAETSITGGRLNQRIANAVVRIHKDFLGRGPTKTQAFYHDNVIVVVMQDTLTDAERSLVAGGAEDAVLEMRRRCELTMRPDLIRAVEDLVGRKVEACLSDNHIGPDVATELFVLDRAIQIERE
jgi:uncharacterized protein YbcI